MSEKKSFQFINKNVGHSMDISFKNMYGPTLRFQIDLIQKSTKPRPTEYHRKS